MTTKIMIADDHPMVVAGQEAMIAKMDGFEVVKSVKDGKELLQALNHVRPDILLLDIHMPNLNGFDSVRAIRKNFSDMKIIFISVLFGPSLQKFMRQQRVQGYLPKNVGADKLLDALVSVRDGGSFIQPPAPGGIPLEAREEFESLQTLEPSPKEFEVLCLLCQAMKHQEIADQLGTSIHTVNSQLKSLYRKLNVRDSKELMAFALRNGLDKEH